MEVIQERPPPLPPKTRVKTGFQSDLGQSVIIRSEDVNGRERRDGGAAPRIITWAQKTFDAGINDDDDNKDDDPPLTINTYYKSDGDSVSGRDDEFLYQNVSNAGTNYIEYKLNGIINGGKVEARNAKNQAPSSRQIEVKQIKNKTVVRISIKDEPKWSEPAEADYANLGGDDQVYANLNASDPECDQTYENQDFAPADEDDAQDGAYENVNVSGGRVSVNVSGDDDRRRVDNAYDKSTHARRVVVTIHGGQSSSDSNTGYPGHRRASSLTSSGVGVDTEEDTDAESNISCDSLNSNELNALSTSEDHGYHTPNKSGSPVEYQNVDGFGKMTNEEDAIYENFQAPEPKPPATDDRKANALPTNLLRDIRSMSVRLSSANPRGGKAENDSAAVGLSKSEGTTEAVVRGEKVGPKVEERSYTERSSKIRAIDVDADQFYKFHLFENREDATQEETFAGIKDYLNREKQSAIKSAKGTIRGVKNRVKAGIATFLQMQENKVSRDEHAGKVVLYITTLGIVRETYHKCLMAKKILRNHIVRFEERDVFMSDKMQKVLKETIHIDSVLVPQLFIDGEYIGNAEIIEKLNESGQLRDILRSYRAVDLPPTCKVCGGYRLLPCDRCKGSKKSTMKNSFADSVPLKCVYCDEVGLIPCKFC